MATLRRALEVIQGTEYRERFTAFLDTDKTVVADVTDFDMQLVIRRRAFQGSPEISRASTLDSRITNGADEGWFEIVIPAQVTSVWPDGSFYYWLNVWPHDNQRATTCWLHGPFKILPGVEVVV